MCAPLKHKIYCGEAVSLFCIGGLGYVILEILWRGFSHWTMFAAGGICMFLVCEMDRRSRGRTPFLLRCLYGAVIITIVEFLIGCIVNLWLQWDVWNYSNLPLNILGQISPPFTAAWMFLSAPIMGIGSFVRRIWGDVPPAKPLFYQS